MTESPTFGEADSYFTEELLIVTKTYPVPSRDYIETTCVAAISSQGELRRLYPVPFRLLERDTQFRRWEWITAKIDRASSDLRPESHRVQAESIVRGQKVDTSNNWNERLTWLRPHVRASFSELEDIRKIGNEPVSAY